MIGNGVDMYDLVNDLVSLDDIRLTALSESIWIGVIEKMNPSPPVPRKSTTCYSRRPVYLFKGRRIFSMVRDYEKNELDFYYIPYDELFFIEKVSI